MGAIHVLDQELINQIAAGEVIERPASVVKELLENALDAGAQSIAVEVQGSGLEQIRVVDDGRGMTPGELELSILRHATSKIAHARDLFSIRTLGFRGEALPSILSVSRSRISSRARDAQSGCSITLEAGEILEKSVKGMNPGTVVEVNDLFFNTPARKKFLKTTATEQRHIIDVVSRYALVHPSMRFSLSINGRTLLNLRENSTLAERVVDLWGKQVRGKLHLLSEARSGISLHGILASPELSRPDRTGICIFVNSRSVLDPTLRTAVLEGYRGALMRHRYPLAVMFLEIDPSEVDVNVHPAKAEVRFRNASALFGLVVAGVRRALAGEGEEERPSPEPRALLGLEPGPSSPGGPCRAEEPYAAYPSSLPFSAPRAPSLHALPGEDRLFAESPGSFRYADKRFVGVSHATYIILEDESSLYLLDQHAAHERVTFERLRSSDDGGREPSQTLLSPLVIELSPSEFRAFEEIAPDLAHAGVEAEPFGDSAIAVRALPAALGSGDIRAIVLDLLGAVLEGGLRKKDHRHEALARIACHASVRAGRKLGPEEVSRLLGDLDEAGSPRTCPHGRPLFKRIERREIERWIGRRP